ncbi:hypothetical protein FQN60_006373 [Etheostoma spectabile]|uniref:Uncharacterized protein n=1 Tax=Etheostoma spectabile TaxID=54343 RepID=A0A5J5CL90_9PERO|nr:hypothetical protein FQN60_006373 [Etheostoma spectabile]
MAQSVTFALHWGHWEDRATPIQEADIAVSTMIPFWRLGEDAALRRRAQAGAAAAAKAAQVEAERRAQRGPAVLGVLVLTRESGDGRQGGLGQAEQVVVGVELTHVADGFP